MLVLVVLFIQENIDVNFKKIEINFNVVFDRHISLHYLKYGQI